MAKSSIHIANGHAGFLAHNDRSQKTVNSIFPHNKNEVWNTKKEAFSMYRFELAARSDAYTKRMHRKLHKNTTTHLSAIVNLNENHDLEDVKKVARLLEYELGTKVFQIALHRDEGHYDVLTKKPVINYHAHLEFMGLDEEGRSIRQKLKRKMLSDLQDLVAMTLKMERGTNYVKERKPRPKRLDTYEFKEHKKRAEKHMQTNIDLSYELNHAMEEAYGRTPEGDEFSYKAKVKDLKKEVATLREELKAKGAGREAYAELEQVNRELKQRIKAKDLSLNELQNELLSVKNSLGVQIHENQEKDALIAHLERLNANLEQENKDLSTSMEELLLKVQEFMSKMETMQEIEETEEVQEEEEDNDYYPSPNGW